MLSLIVAVAFAQERPEVEALRGRPHLSIEWLLARGPADEPKEITDLRDQFLATTRTRDWPKALELSAKLFEKSKNDAGILEMARAEIFLLQGRPDDALAVAQKYLQPYKSARGKTFATYADYHKFVTSLPDEKRNDAEARDDQERFPVWRFRRNAALDLAVEALRMKGDIAGALKLRELMKRDREAQTPVEPPRGWYYADIASQDEPFQAAVRGIDSLKALAKGGYKPQALDDYSPEDQIRLVSVFANVTLGHLLAANGDAIGARAAFSEAKKLIDQRPVVVNRECLQFLILREILSR